ncbi:MAG: hypothetical protein Q7S64_02910 [bacterium]|nr:hypothetical protein [bacterium]
MKRETVRLTEMSVQLTLMLASIIRDQLHLWLCGYECWTFEHVANWDVNGVDPGPDATEAELYGYHVYEHPISRHCAYLGSGHCHVSDYGERRLKYQVVELRVRCEHCDWTATGLKHWDIWFWLKLADGTVEAHQFRCDLNYGTDKDIRPIDNLKKIPYPPERIGFASTEDPN